MTHRLRNVALCATLLGAVPAGAHSAKHSEPVKAFHGGQSLAAGPYHLELVAKDGELLLYVMDHSDKAIATGGARAKATIQHGFEKDTTQVELEPSGDNILKGTGSFTIQPDTGIIVFMKLPEREAYAARFTPLNAKSGAASKAESLHKGKQ
ncbi:MAG: hypothetical protein A4E19_05780 [Nitrospira sp. SG-bin1]|nr:MAG: hypothetical protein A4E19_05780 [Nitrospira sp. SG-bin1]